MSRIFLSHSSANNAEAIALRDWLVAEGWSDLFLDLDPNRGIAAGERWERALNEAARRCEAVLFLISKAWLSSRWCMNELTLARRLNKRLFGVLVEEGLAIADLPADVTSTWQLVNLGTGRDHQQFRVTLPVTGEEAHVTYSREGLARLRAGLQRAGLHASYFAWPPETDPKRSPYRGLRPLEADDAGIFFGREAPVIEAIDRLRGLTEAAPPRLLVILGASGAGKSSFLRAGLLPRLGRDPQTFLPLPIIRPERAAISGEAGLVSALASAFKATSLKVARGEIREAVAGGAATLQLLLARLQEASHPPTIDGGPTPKPPTLVLTIDQGEELFLAEAQGEAQPFLTLLRDLVIIDQPAIIAVFTIRSDNYERLQSAPKLDGMHQETLSLPPMPKGSYAEVVKSPIHRLDGTARAIRMDDALVDALLADIEAGGAKDALPLLAFTLERLYEEYGGTGHLALDHFNKLGRVKGSIEAAVARAFQVADANARIPRDSEARLTLLRRGLIPWLAGIDPDTKAPRRRVARLSEIPAEARPLIDLLVEQRLLSTDVAKDTGETTIEPAHEALLRQWGLLQGWLEEDTGLLTVLDGIKRAVRDWSANGEDRTWLAHRGDRLGDARSLNLRPDVSGLLDQTDRRYLDACQHAELTALKSDRRNRALMTSLLLCVIAGLLGWINQVAIKEQFNWFAVMRPYMNEHVRPHVLSPAAELALAHGQSFKECAEHCPEMVVVPPGSFTMGSPMYESGRQAHEGPQTVVTIPHRLAVSKVPVTIDQWDACVAVGACQPINDGGMGRGSKPVIRVSWHDAQTYVAWLSRMTGKTYRLLSEAEWEYAARAGTTTPYPWGSTIGFGNSNCRTCGTEWSGRQTSPVGSFRPNAFGLMDMHGNVHQWVEDCYHDSHAGRPADAAPRVSGDCNRRVIRGGGWNDAASALRSASRNWNSDEYRYLSIGIRVARTLLPGSHDAQHSARVSPPDVTAPQEQVEQVTAFRASLLATLAGVVPSLTDRNRQQRVEDYLATLPNRALAASPPLDTWRVQGWPNPAIAEERVLESCEMRYGRPCILVASNSTAHGRSEHQPPRGMPRVNFNGAFDPAMIPAINESTRSRMDVVRYRTADGAKAAAIHPIGHLFIVSGAPSQHAAEANALQRCNLAPSRNNLFGPCLLYAAGDQVVLPQRHVHPVSPP